MGNKEQVMEGRHESSLDRFRQQIGILVEEARRAKEQYDEGKQVIYNANAVDIETEFLTEEDRMIWEKIQEKDQMKMIEFSEFHEYRRSVEKELRDAKQHISDTDVYERMKRSREAFRGLAADKAQQAIDGLASLKGFRREMWRLVEEEQRKKDAYQRGGSTEEFNPDLVDVQDPSLLTDRDQRMYMQVKNEDVTKEEFDEYSRAVRQEIYAIQDEGERSRVDGIRGGFVGWLANKATPIIARKQREAQRASKQQP